MSTIIARCCKCKSLVHHEYMDECVNLIIQTCNCDAEFFRTNHFWYRYIFPNLLRFLVCICLYACAPLQLAFFASSCLLLIMWANLESHLLEIQNKEIQIVDSFEIDGQEIRVGKIYEA